MGCVGVSLLNILNTSHRGMARCGTSPATSATCRYRLPYSQKLKGVIRMASAVLMAVRLTDNSMFAFERELMKFEMLPPGQEATRIMPSAMVQLMDLPKASASRKVNSGRMTSWLTMPRISDLGFLNTFTNILGLIPRATPYITKASTMLMVFIPPALRVTSMLSIRAVVSGVISTTI